MKDEKEKKGFFARLAENKKDKKSSCCCNIEIEEIPEDEKENKTSAEDTDNKGNCCG
ncbi:MAG: hypothetical protein BWY11_02265 [Firmicutes bacterium ADurb.Bin182]|nr:MAG: hypothetical protein BWY11_02265 [Firmicutes bacterium ADurb.Bin182]